LIQVFVVPLIGQQANAVLPVEKVGLLTDRTLYIAGEQVQFSATISSSLQSDRSKVLYVELITPNGKRIEGDKFLIVKDATQGCLAIPEDAVTGYYYLRAYTKYMRNAGPGAYTYVAIKMVNPLSNEVLPGGEDHAFSQTRSMQDAGQVFTISLEKNEFAKDENVNATISMNHTGYPYFDSLFSVSVVPEVSSFLFPIQPTAVDLSVDSVDFRPETRGISITGQLMDGATGQPVANGRVNLSIIGQGRDFEAMQTDSAGRYFFALPAYTGQRDIFLCAETDTLKKPILRVDNDFCTLPVHLPSPEFQLTKEERAVAFRLYRNARVSKHFYPDTIRCVYPEETTVNPFYGRPSDVLVFDNFVQLPTLEEYFNELPSAVKVRKQNGHKYFKVIGERAEMNFFTPLVMIDWVAVNNPEKILAASPNNIDRIEVVTVPYIKGNITYGGIVSIISRKGNFAGIDLPNSGIFFNYKFYADTCHCAIRQIVDKDQPDSRNTVYWDPALRWDNHQRAEFSFISPSTPGRYNIVVQGIQTNGEIYRQSAGFVVKERE
jgi:hypothetical protein